MQFTLTQYSITRIEKSEGNLLLIKALTNAFHPTL